MMSGSHSLSAHSPCRNGKSHKTSGNTPLRGTALLESHKGGASGSTKVFAFHVHLPELLWYMMLVKYLTPFNSYITPPHLL
jgi:hypothetical protein